MTVGELLDFFADFSSDDEVKILLFTSDETSQSLDISEAVDCYPETLYLTCYESSYLEQLNS